MTQAHPPPEGWGQVHHYYQAPAPPETNVLAVISLVALLLWLCWLGSIVGVVTGHIARSQIKAQGQSGDAFAVAGLVLGYLGLAILACYVALFAMGALATLV